MRSLKPDQRIYFEACRRFEVSPKECIFIDDRFENVQAAQSIGMYGIAFASADQLAAELKRANLKF